MTPFEFRLRTRLARVLVRLARLSLDAAARLAPSLFEGL
jgi:hypothetical protein